MIGYDRLGTNGRLGNQMFQYASLRGIAANNNLEFCIPPEDTPTLASYGLFECFKLPNVNHTGLIWCEEMNQHNNDASMYCQHNNGFTS